MRILSLAMFLLAGLVTPALAAADWNGTWVGNWQSADGNGVQIMMAGNVATGIFWNGDYLPDELHASVSADGKTLTITWDHASAVLTRSGAETADAVIHEPGKPDAKFAVKIDH
ncbi:MAG TPA: hypothetical protein VII56_16140 [Rhizomicrobium sp.]